MRPCLLVLAVLPAFASGCAAPGTGPASAGSSRLLTAADLPAGFQPVSPPTDPAGKSDPAACGAAMDELKATGATAADRADFTDAGGVTRIREILRTAETPQITAARQALAQCPSYKLTAADGTAYDMTTAIVDTTATGFTTTVRQHAATDDVYEILVVDRVGTTMMVLSYAGPAEPDLAATTALARKAADRLR